MFLLLFVIFVSCQGFLLDGNTQTTTTVTSLDDKRYNIIMGLLTEERRSRSKLEAIVAQELLVLKQEVAKCQCGNGNGGHNQINNQGSLANDTKVLKDEIIHLKRDHELLKTEVVELIQNNTVLKDKVVVLERNLTTMQNKQCDLNMRNETRLLEKALQATNNKVNALINGANSRKQDFIGLFRKFTRLDQKHRILKDNVILIERNINIMANSRNQSFSALSEKVAGLVQNVMQLEQNFTIENTKSYLSFRNETRLLEKALQATNNKVNALINGVNSRKQDFIGLFRKFTRLVQNHRILKDNVILIERNINIMANSRNQSFSALSEKVAGLVQNVMQLERNFTTENTKSYLSFRNETRLLEKALQATNNNVNALINGVNSRKQDFIGLFRKFTRLVQNHRILKDNVILIERNINIMANSRNQSFSALSEKVAGLVQNVMQLEQNFTIENTKSYLSFRNETRLLEKALQATNNKVNALINGVNSRKQDFIGLFRKFTRLVQNHRILKDNVILIERNINIMANSRNQSFSALSEKVAGLVQNVMQLEQNFTIENTKSYLSFRNETRLLEKALQATNNKVNALINGVNSRKQDFIGLFRKFTRLVQNHRILKDNVILIERNINIMANSRNQSFSALSEKVAGLVQNVMQLERNFTIENTKSYLSFRNETSHLAKALQITNNKLIATTNEANFRIQSFITLSEKVAGLMQNHTVLKDNVIQLERNLTMGNAKCRNESSHLESALQLTNNKLNAILNEANATKQDFIALFQKVQSTEQRLENSTKSLEASQNMTFLKLQREIINGARLVEQNISDRTKLLEMRENSTSLKLQQQTVMLQQELNKMSNRVVLTTCKYGDAKNGVIQFTNVKIVNGIHNTDSIRNSGIFTCENPGLYLISVFIKTSTQRGFYNVNKNTNHIADGLSSITDYYQTTSVTILVQLTVTDTISVTGSLFVYGGYESCLTILQIQ